MFRLVYRWQGPEAFEGEEWLGCLPRGRDRAWLKRTNAPIEIRQKLMRHANIQTALDTYGKETEVADLHRQAHSRVVKMILPKGESAHEERGTAENPGLTHP